MAAKRTRSNETPAQTLGVQTVREVHDEGGLSLERLSAAMQGLLRTGEDPYEAPAVDPASDSAAIESPADADAACEVTPRTILEAMLFVGHPQNEPLTSLQVSGLMRGVRPAEIDALVRALNRDYSTRRCPYWIVADGAGYRLALRDEFARTRDKLYGRARQARLSQAAVEVLAAVAYHQPVTAEEVARLRGMPSGNILLQLVRRQLLRCEREPGTRKSMYSTTKRFLELFGLSSLDDMPRSPDLDAT